MSIRLSAVAQDSTEVATEAARGWLGFSEPVLLGNLVASAALLAAVVLLRFAARRALQHAPWRDDGTRARIYQNLGQASILALILGLIVIWAPELHTFALSAVALAAALVLATKELIMCLSGALLRASTGAYDLGDRIEIDGLRGDVIRMGLLSTTVLETGPAHQRNGRAVVFPNSLLLNKPVVNETFTDDYVLHTFVVPLDASANWQDAERRLLALAHEVCAPWLDAVRQRMERLAHDHDLSAPNAEPKVSLQQPDARTLHLLVRIPTPARQKARLEQQILRRFLGAPATPGSD